MLSPVELKHCHATGSSTRACGRGITERFSTAMSVPARTGPTTALPLPVVLLPQLISKPGREQFAPPVLAVPMPNG